MGRRLAAAALLALSLLWVASASPLADARGRAAREAAAPPPEGEGPAPLLEETAAEAEAGDGGLFLTEIVEPAGSLADLRAVEAADVPAEGRDAARWAVYRELLPRRENGTFGSEEPVSRGEAVQALYRLSGIRVPVDVCPYPDVPEALNWVMDRGLYKGMTDHGLYPDLPVSRLQLAVILAGLQEARDPLAGALDLPEGGEASLSRQKHGELDQAVAAAARRHGAVGVQVAVLEKGAVTDAYHYGWAVKGSVPMSSAHKLRTASLSKVAAGLAAALLWEEGAVDYDTDIGAYWGVKTWKPVTIRSLLSHTSTLRNSESIAWDYAGVRAQLGSASGYGGGTPGELRYWSYNNHAFGVLGQTLELAAGRYLDDVLEERVLGPLGAEGSFTAGELAEPELVTPLYRGNGLGRSASSVLSVRQWSAPGATGRQFAGGFTASALDMAKLTALLAGDGCFEGVRLMDAASVELMESHGDQALPGGIYQALPMRLRFGAYGRERLYYHTGSAYGAYNFLSYDPDTGDGVVVLTMGADGGKDAYGIYAVCGEISRAVYEALAPGA